MLHRRDFPETGFRDSLVPMPARFALQTRNGTGDPAVTFQPLLSAALDLLRMSVMLTDPEAHLIYANRYASDLLSKERGLRVSLGRLSATNPKCSLRLKEAVQQCAQRTSEELPLGIALLIPLDDAANIAAWVHPTRLRADDKHRAVVIFVRSAAAMFCSEIFAATFGATRAEIRVLKLLMSGLSVKNICAKLSLSSNTVRTHLKSLYAKTGTRGQAELVSLASASIAPASADKLNAL